jgi:hypothetical protein
MWYTSLAELRTSVTIRYVSDMPLDAPPGRVVERLDAGQRAMAGGDGTAVTADEADVDMHGNEVRLRGNVAIKLR